jgi:hypothetical protein
MLCALARTATPWHISKMDYRDPRIEKTARLLLVAILSFGLGQISGTFRYGALSWIAIFFCLFGVGLILFTLVREVWKSKV